MTLKFYINLNSLVEIDQSKWTNFDANYGSNAMCQWLGPFTSRVKVKTASHTEVVPDGLDKFITITKFHTCGHQNIWNL